MTATKTPDEKPAIEAPPEKLPEKLAEQQPIPAARRSLHDEKADKGQERGRDGERARAADPVVQSTSVSKPKSAFSEPGLDALDALDCEAIALGLASDVRPLAGLAGYVDWRMCGRLSGLLRSGALTGAPDEQVLMPTLGLLPARRIFVFGWGPASSMAARAPKRFAHIVEALLKAGVERVAVALPEPALPLLGFVDEHLRRPLGARCGAVFGPDPWLAQTRDTRPIPAPPEASP